MMNSRDEENSDDHDDEPQMPSKYPVDQESWKLLKHLPKYTLWLFNTLPWYRWPIEIDGLPFLKMGVWFSMAMSVSHNQRV